MLQVMLKYIFYIEYFYSTFIVNVFVDCINHAKCCYVVDF